MRKRKASSARRVTAKQTVVVMAAFLLLACVAIAVLPVPKGGIDFRHLGRDDTPTVNALYREIRWNDLSPDGWDPSKDLRDLQREGAGLVDSDARAIELLRKSREIWDNAPVNPAMNGAAVRIPGYVVPMDEDRGKRREFLLVPYFGACIHSPPPPSNQILHVRMATPVGELRSMDTVWVSGRLSTVRTDSSRGVSSYALEASSLERYTPRPPQ